MDDLYKDNLHITEYFGIVVDNSDPTFNGRIKIRVYGKFDELDVTDIPWAMPGNVTMTNGGNHSVPKLNNIVKVKFENGNIYTPIWYNLVHYSTDMIEEIKTSYPNSHVFVYDVDTTPGPIKSFFTQEKGYIIDYNSNILNITPENEISLTNKEGSFIQINSDDTITIEHKEGSNIEIKNDNSIILTHKEGSNIEIKEDSTLLLQHKDSEKQIHILKDKISIGSENESDEPAVLGEKNVTALTEIVTHLEEVITAIDTFHKTQSGICKSVPYLSPLLAGHEATPPLLDKVKSLINSKTKVKTIPDTRSDTISLDGPSKK